MAFLQSDLDALDRAIALGAYSVRYADGREVKYRSLPEMNQLREKMKRELGIVDQNRAAFVIEHRR